MKASSAISPVISVDRNDDRPLHRQIYDAYRSMIVRGDLAAGQQVPSSRSLASELGLSRIPVLEAYGQLLAEGYFESRAGSGTFVSASLPEQLTSCESRETPKTKAHSGPRITSERSALIPARANRPRARGWGAFNVGQTGIDHFPSHVWSRLVAKQARMVDRGLFNFYDPKGSQAFREAISVYLRTARAVHCDPEQIMIVSGSQQALGICALVLHDPGSPVWIEEPGYPFLRYSLAIAGCRLVPVPVDEEGLDVRAGIKRQAQARAAYVTPSHQFPLGVTMSASRRLQLLDWAQSSGSWIVEDDYDSEYRYESMPIASLQGLDRNSRVIYIGTFSKTLFPSLRLGYVVTPSDLVDRFVAVRLAMDLYPPYFFQAVMTDFINEGHFARHIRKTRLIYRQQRDALVNALRSEFGSSLEIAGGEGGMHIVVTLPGKESDWEIVERAAEQNLWLWPLSSCYMAKPSKQGLILGFGSAKTSEISRGVRKLKALLR